MIYQGNLHRYCYTEMLSVRVIQANFVMNNLAFILYFFEVNTFAYRCLVPIVHHRAHPILAHCSLSLHVVKYPFFIQMSTFPVFNSQSQGLLEYKAMNVERRHRVSVKPWSDSIHISLWRNDGFVHSFDDFSKSNVFSKNFIRTKFILHKIFFRMSIFSSSKT